MGTITKPYTFSNGATIVAAEHNSNFDTAYNEFNGNIDNTNIKANAGIVDTKLDAITTANKVSAAALASLSSLPSGAGYLPLANITGVVTTGANSTITSITGLTTPLAISQGGTASTTANAALNALLPSQTGSANNFLTTNGTNTSWAAVTSSNLSNVIYSWTGVVDKANTWGLVNGASLTVTTGHTYSYLISDNNSNQILLRSKFVKISGISTLTIWCSIWQNSTDSAICRVDAGSVNGTVTGTGAQQTPEWKSFTLDISGLTNGSTYDLTTGLYASGVGTFAYLGAIIIIGS